MANKKIKYSDLAEDKLFQPAIDSANQLIAALDKLEKQFKELLIESKKLSDENPFKSYEDFKKAETAANKAKKAVSELEKIEQQRAKLQERLNQLEAGQLDASIKLREEIAAQTRARKQQAKESSAASTAYEKESARLVRLRREYKDLAAQNKANTKEGKELLKNIQQLDRKLKDIDESVGQNQRSVGNYRIAVDRLTGSFKLLAASGVVAALAQIVQLFNQNTEGSSQLQKVLGRITVTFSVLVGRFVKAIPVFQQLFSNLQGSIDRFGLQIQKAFASLPELLGGSAEKVKALDTQIAALDAQAAASAPVIDQLAEAFAGVGDEISSLIDTNDNLIDRTIKYQKQINSLNQETEKLRTEQRKLQIASDDNTTSLEEQAAATAALIEKNNEIAQNEISVTAKRLELAQLNAKVNKNNLEAQTELADAFIANEAAKGEAAAVQAEGLRRLREIERDNIELDLDQLIDIADKRKTINEQIAADERNSLEQRRAALSEIGADIESSFLKQAEKIQEGLSASFNIDDLINETDTVKLNERIKAIGLDEIRQNRLREIIQERLQAVQDLAVAQEDLNDTEQQAREIQSDILLQEEALKQLQESRIPVSKVLQKLEEDRIQNEIDNLKTRISLAKEGSTELLELNQQLNDKLLEQNQLRIEKEKDQQQEISKLTLDFISNFAEKRSEARLKAIDEEISATEERQNQLRELAQAGVENAEQNLATEEKKQAELERKREQAARRQQQIQLVLASVETYNSKVQAGDKNPLASTVAEIAALEAFIASLPAFWDGAENIAESLGSPDIAGRDGYIVRVDGSERVLTGQQNAMIGKMSNMELATLASNHKKGKLQQNNAEVVAELKQLASIIDSKPVYLGRDYDATKKAIIDVVAKKGRIERNHRKGNSLF